jgi:hypothetical protein
MPRSGGIRVRMTGIVPMERGPAVTGRVARPVGVRRGKKRDEDLRYWAVA